MRANKDVFHDAFTNKPHHVSSMSPLHVQGCELLEGAFETVGSKICWTYTLAEGAKKISKQIIEVVDHEKKVITFKEFEGDLVNKYDNFKGNSSYRNKRRNRFSKLTIEYERPNENVPELVNLLDFIIGMTNAIDDHHVN
uniref:Bet v I/Major latex protein domain-containing protein n=1 Tax=Solanum lycopersicum TaxID=4081 RepID=A0A3Q7HZB1_SOLLC